MPKCAHCGHFASMHPPRSKTKKPYREKCVFLISSVEGKTKCPCIGWEMSKQDKRRAKEVAIAKSRIAKSPVDDYPYIELGGALCLND